MVNSISDIINKNVVVEDDFNLFFDTSLGNQDKNPILKKKPLPNLIEIMETFDLSDLWRVRNTKSKRLTHSWSYLKKIGLLFNLQFFTRSCYKR